MKTVLFLLLLFSFMAHAEDEMPALTVHLAHGAASRPLPGEKCDPIGAMAAADGEPLSGSKTAMAEDVAVAAGQYQASDVYDLLGHCVKPDQQADIAERKIIPQLKERFKTPGKAMQRKPSDADYLTEMPKVRKDNGEMATENDWIAIDLLARTLFSEVGSNGACGDEYVNAIGKLILNRADMSQSSEGARETFLKGKDIAGAHPVTNVVLAPRQFAVWGAKNDAKRWAACPARNYVQKYSFKDKQGRDVVSGGASNNLWKRSIETATAIIFREKAFRRATAGFTALHYTTSEAEATQKRKQCYRPAGDVIGGKRVNRSDCMEAWVAPTGAEQRACAGR